MVRLRKIDRTYATRLGNLSINFAKVSFFPLGELICARRVTILVTERTGMRTRKFKKESNHEEQTVFGGTLPASLTDCATGLTAAQSIDGSAHQNILKWTKSTTAASTAATDASFVNPWGTAYTYSQANRTLTTTPKDASGTDMTVVTRYF